MAEPVQLKPTNLDPAFAGARAYEFYRKIGSPKFVVAPMVNQSEVGFRMLTRKYNAELCYTPMMQAKKFGEDATYRKLNWDAVPQDRPLFAQFCANDPHQLLAAAKQLEHQCDAIDINLGCPQGIARRGHYGSFLLTEPDLICSMVSILYENLSIPVTCKIRKLDNDEDTLRLCHRLQASGCTILTLHGRTKEQKKNLTSVTDWDLIRRVKKELTIPVFANGSIERLADVHRCLEYTGCDGVMVSEAILENPALFSSDEAPDTLKLAEEFIEFNKKYPSPLSRAAVKPHLFKMLYRQLSHYTDTRSLLGTKGVATAVIESIPSVLRAKQEQEQDLAALYAGIPSWYNRHLLPPKPGQAPGSSHKPKPSDDAECTVCEEEEQVAPADAAAAVSPPAVVPEGSRTLPLDLSQLKSAGELALEVAVARHSARQKSCESPPMHVNDAAEESGRAEAAEAPASKRPRLET